MPAIRLTNDQTGEPHYIEKTRIVNVFLSNEKRTVVYVEGFGEFYVSETHDEVLCMWQAQPRVAALLITKADIDPTMLSKVKAVTKLDRLTL